jgi:Plasmid rolling circle replication initiator protein and truncated derivatives
MGKKQAKEKLTLENLTVDDFTKLIVKPKKNNALIFADWAFQLGVLSNERAFGFNRQVRQKLKNGHPEEQGKVTAICECGNTIKFVTNEDKSKKHLNNARFCHWRFCALCAWRLSLKRTFVTKVVLTRLSNLSFRFLFVTLTAPNVKAEDLSDEITRLNEAWSRMTKRKKYKDLIVGGIRKIEVTYNSKTDTYHPHLHIVLCVEKSYFKRGSKRVGEKVENYYPNMIMFEEWQSDWQQALRDKRAEQINVQAISSNPKKLAKAIAEISKYSAKDSEMVQDKKVFEAMYFGMKGKRLFSPFGLMKKLFREFEADPNSFSDCFEMREPEEWVYKIMQDWNSQTQSYETQGYQKMSAKEILEANQRYVGFVTEGLNVEDEK